MSNDDQGLSFLRRHSVFLAALVAVILLALSVRLLGGVLNPPPPAPTPMPTFTPVPTPVVTITDIRAKAELTTVEYRAVAEIRDERVPDDFRQYLGVKEQVLLLAYGDVKAGFDLDKLSAQDLWTDGTRVQLHLPPPEVLSISIDYQRTHVVFHQKNLLMSQDINWGNKLFETASEAIRQEALQAGILEDAAQYGQLYFENFLRSLGFSEVRVIVN